MTDYVPDLKPLADTIGAAQLARLIGLDEALLGELANRARLPFAVSTERGLHIAPGDLAAWLGARRRYAHWLDDTTGG
jgi:hypothetical protein